jgi:hypothetical protein
MLDKRFGIRLGFYNFLLIDWLIYLAKSNLTWDLELQLNGITVNVISCLGPICRTILKLLLIGSCDQLCKDPSTVFKATYMWYCYSLSNVISNPRSQRGHIKQLPLYLKLVIVIIWVMWDQIWSGPNDHIMHRLLYYFTNLSIICYCRKCCKDLQVM